jgi:hypothetical protein
MLVPLGGKFYPLIDTKFRIHRMAWKSGCRRVLPPPFCVVSPDGIFVGRRPAVWPEPRDGRQVSLLAYERPGLKTVC